VTDLECLTFQHLHRNF